MCKGTRRRHRGASFAARRMGALVAAATAAASFAVHAAGWTTLGGNPQHSGLSPTAAQSLELLHWSTPVDLALPAEPILIHYGSPLITPANTVIIPIRTDAANGFRLDARSGTDGALVWSAGTDYQPPPHGWLPSYAPALTAANRVYYPGAGGTILFRDDADAAAPGATGRLAFYGLANYESDPASYDATVFVNTPITVDADGSIYFGFRTVGSAPLGLASGIARIDAAGNGSWIAASAAADDVAVDRVPHQAAPALTADGQTLYVSVAASAFGGVAYLVALDAATLAPKEVQPGVPMRVALRDPRNGGASNAWVSDNSSASPMVGPDGDVYYGVLGNPSNGSRGWLLHYSGDLQQTKTPGGFGWDNTAAVVPAAAVASYAGSSSYLLFSKYNDYAGSDGGEGVHRIAVLDPNDTMVEPHASSNGALVMKQVISAVGPTPDPDYFPDYPNAVYEWCINAAAVDPITGSVMVNSEDGKVYRWDLATNALTQAVTLSPGVGEAYTSTLIGPDGTVYATNWGILNAVGQQNATPVLTGVASRKGHAAAGVFDLALAPTPLAPTIEPRAAAASNAHSIVFTFDKLVRAGTASVTEGGAIAGSPTFSGSEMTVPLTGVVDGSYVSVEVSDVASGDGGIGGGGSVRVGFLAGDVNGSGNVSLSDLLAVNAVLAQLVSPANFLRDVNLSGALSVGDLLHVNARLTHVLPPP